MDPFRLIADRKIEEAMQEGAFENLAGSGKPLPLEDEPFEDPSLRMAHKLLRNNGFAPAWIEDGKEIDEAVAKLTEDRVRQRISEAEYRLRSEALNRRILTFNLRAPAASVHKRLIGL